jgi:Kelch motif/Galactose oxidase, central domain
MQSRALTWLISLLAILLIAVPARVGAQQRVFASVEPNHGVFNGSVDLYDAARGSFDQLPQAGASPRSLHTATMLSNGMVLVAGGYDGSFLSSAQLYDPAAGVFIATGGLLVARRDHTATLLSSGKVLLVGGYNGQHLGTAELYDPSTGTFAATSGAMGWARSSHSATLVGERVLLVGGFNGGYLNTAELYDPSSDAFAATSATMTAARSGHTATPLANGRVLIAGGSNSTSFLRTAETFDPAGTFTATTGPMLVARSRHTATRLPSGKVLIAGGFNGNYLDTAEIFDPATGTFTAVAASMSTPRSGHTAVALADGRVLLAGGESPFYLDTAEIYDEASGRFILVAARMAEPRAGHSATALSDGSVIVLGGRNRALLQFDTNLDQSDNISPNILFSADSKVGYVSYTGSGTLQISFTVAQIFSFNPALEYVGRLEISSDRSQVAGYVSIGEARLGFLSFTLERMDGLPLFTNRLHDWVVPEIVRPDGTPVELDFVNPNYNQGSYDLTRVARDGGVLETRSANTAFPTNRQPQLFSDVFTQPGGGRLLLTGGQADGTAINSSDTYDPSTGSFQAAGAMTSARTAHTMTLLPSGKILVAGGHSAGTALATAEVYDRGTGTFTATAGSMSVARERHAATLLPSGKVLVIGGRGSGSTHRSAELYDPGSGSFAATAGEMVAGRFGQTATLLRTGRVLVAGGNDGENASASAELYDPETATFSTTGSMNSARAFHTAMLLQDGRVLIAGGYNESYLNTAEVYDPATATFTTVGTMNSLRQDHTSTLLPDGRVLIAGGYNGSSLTACDLYEPSANGFTAAGAMSTPRREPTTTLLPDGRVLIAGGRNGETALNTAELFDPGNGVFAAAGTMTTARSGHTAAFLEAGEDGYLRAVSGAGLIFAEFYGGDRASAVLKGIDVSKFSGVTKLSGSLLGVGAASKAVLNLINANEETAEVRLVLHRADGTPLGEPRTAVLLKASQLKADLASIFGGDVELVQAAWLEVNGSVDRVVGTLTISDAEENVLTSYELFSTPLTQFIFPMAAADGNFRTGIVLLATDLAANVTVELWGPGGTLDRSATLLLQPGMRTLSYLEDLFAGLDSRVVSNLRVRSDQPIHGLSFMIDRGLRFLATVPAIPFPLQE